MPPINLDKYGQEAEHFFDDCLDEDDFRALETGIGNGSRKRRLEDEASVGPPRKQLHLDGTDQHNDDHVAPATESITLSKPMKHDSMQLARRVLQEYFGFEAFRQDQERAIANILCGRNTLVIFPTGAGKSLCYQIPAIAFPDVDAMDGSDDRRGGPGITIVVSPLIALMKDQVDALRKRRVEAECVDSTKTYQELLQITQRMKNGKLRLLYCAPERLNNEAFVASIKDIPGGIRLVAVDEAHCVSQVRMMMAVALASRGGVG